MLLSVKCRFYLRLLLCIAGSVFFAPSLVFATCTTTNQFTITAPTLAVTLSVGEDFPIGGLIRTQFVRNIDSITVNCSGSNAQINWILLGGVLYPGASNIYQTGVDGVGVRFGFGNISDRYYPAVERTNSVTIGHSGWGSFRIELVKMGPITPGVVNASFFPAIRIEASDSDNTPVRFTDFMITGNNIMIQVPTCITPDFNYNLGTFDMTRLRVASDASDWVDTPVILSGCSVFYGNGSTIEYKASSPSNGSTISSNDPVRNMVTITLTPTTETIDSINGIVALDENATALGFGVQLASRESGNYEPWNLSEKRIVVTPVLNDSSGMLSFPIGARIIRTNTGARPGSISTSVIYTINYQ